MKKKEKKEKINWKRTFRNNKFMLGLIMKSCPGYFWLHFISTIFFAVNSFLMSTYLFQYVLNALQEGKELRFILITLGCILGYTVFCTVLDCLFQRYFDLNDSVIEAYIQNLLQTKAAEVELACFESSDFYDTYVKASSDATSKAYNVMWNLLDVVWVVVNATATVAVVVTIEPMFLIIAGLPLLVTLLVGKRRNRVAYERDMLNEEKSRQIDYVRRVFYLSDYAKEMRLTEMWKVMFRRMNRGMVDLKEIAKKYGYRMMFFRYLSDFMLNTFVPLGSIVFATFRTLVLKTMLIGDCFVVINSIGNIAWNITYIGDMVLKLDSNSLYAENLRSFLEYEVKIAEDETAPAVPAFEMLELRDLTFTYEGQETPALSHVNLTIHAGEKIAVVGHNGAGKTTLIKLLQRLYDPVEGEILLNGKSIKDYRLSSYRALFGTVFQDYHLFATTVAENVMLRGDITDEDRELVKESLRKAGISEKIESLPKGVDTYVTKEFDGEGAVFSGGEAQKISIARIFAGGHEIVIMDEPTSALDPIAEQEMYRNMFAAAEGKTMILISHRLSSATMADRVYLFEHGAITEQGTHKEMLAMNGTYANMWHKQAGSYLDGEGEEVTA